MEKHWVCMHELATTGTWLTGSGRSPTCPDNSTRLLGKLGRSWTRVCNISFNHRWKKNSADRLGAGSREASLVLSEQPGIIGMFSSIQSVSLPREARRGPHTEDHHSAAAAARLSDTRRDWRATATPAKLTVADPIRGLWGLTPPPSPKFKMLWACSAP